MFLEEYCRDEMSSQNSSRVFDDPASISGRVVPCIPKKIVATLVP
jgi:hypothetical protein